MVDGETIEVKAGTSVWIPIEVELIATQVGMEPVFALVLPRTQERRSIACAISIPFDAEIRTAQPDRETSSAA